MFEAIEDQIEKLVRVTQSTQAGRMSYTGHIVELEPHYICIDCLNIQGQRTGTFCVPMETVTCFSWDTPELERLQALLDAKQYDIEHIKKCFEIPQEAPPPKPARKKVRK